MSMKIAGQATESALATQTTRAQETAKTAGTGRTGSAWRSGEAGGDSVEISDLAGRMEHVSAADQNRIEDRIEVLRAMYNRGEYNPDASKLSRALVSHGLGGTVEVSKA